jgi:ankyrin repeat protein
MNIDMIFQTFCMNTNIWLCNAKIINISMVVTFVSTVRELVTQDKNAVNDEDENSNTALHLAALAGHAKVAEVLIEFGADVAARCVIFYSVLLFITVSHSVQMIIYQN